jgi:hypothetical protein
MGLEFRRVDEILREEIFIAAFLTFETRVAFPVTFRHFNQWRVQTSCMEGSIADITVE